MLIKEIRHNTANFLRRCGLSNTFFYKILLFVNNILFHRNEKMKRKNYGEENAEITFYVIRCNSEEEGLMSIYLGCVQEIEYALGKGYIPFIDLQNNVTQYTTGELINGTRNAWEYFWEQPSGYGISEIYRSRNVILSGRDRKVDREKQDGKISCLLKTYNFQDVVSTCELCRFMKKNMNVKAYIYKRVEDIWRERFGKGKTIGVFIRGTDYAALRPKGHPIQPSKEHIYERLMELRNRHSDSRVFLVTEDDGIYRFFREKLKTDLIEVEDIRFSQYKGDDYIFKYCKGNAYQIGLCYLSKLLLLSKCNYLVTSIANGSKFSNIMNDNHYEERIVIDLGVYK